MVPICVPIWVKISGERHVRAKKRYIVLFICFSTKAIHIEVVSDLTSEALYAAFKRMIARRGNVRNLYCDNGTNFVGTRNILQLESEKAIKQFNDEIHEKLLMPTHASFSILRQLLGSVAYGSGMLDPLNFI